MISLVETAFPLFFFRSRVRCASLITAGTNLHENTVFHHQQVSIRVNRCFSSERNMNIRTHTPNPIGARKFVTYKSVVCIIVSPVISGPIAYAHNTREKVSFQLNRMATFFPQFSSQIPSALCNSPNVVPKSKNS